MDNWEYTVFWFLNCCYCSVAKSYLTLYDPMNCSLLIGFSKMTKMYLQPISQILGKSYLEIEKFKKQQHRPAIDDCWGVDLNDFGMVFTISWLSYSLVYFLKVAMVSFMVVSPGTIRIRWGFSHLELLYFWFLIIIPYYYSLCNLNYFKPI